MSCSAECSPGEGPRSALARSCRRCRRPLALLAAPCRWLYARRVRTIAFATSSAEAPLTADDRLAVASLASLGYAVVPLVWDTGPLLDGLAGIVIRSCWDYHVKVAAFRTWLDELERREIPVWNPVHALRWNLDKLYLRELAAGGVAIPQTLFLSQGPALALSELLTTHGISQAVIKPSVSLSADRTFRVDARSTLGWQPAFEELLTSGRVLVQAFVPEVQTEGELSLVFFDRRFSHAVRKRPRAGDFRVQVDHGGTREPCTPPAWVVARAAECLALASGELPYARVDGIVVGDELVIMELELIDPVLFLAYAPGAAERFAEALAGRFAK